MVLIFYATYISVDLAHHEIFRAKVGKGGIKRQSYAKNVVFPAKDERNVCFLINFRVS